MSKSYCAIDVTAEINGRGFNYDPLRVFTVKAGEVFDVLEFGIGLAEIVPAAADRYFRISPPKGDYICEADEFKIRCACAGLNGFTGTVELRDFPYYTLEFVDGVVISERSAFTAQEEEEEDCETLDTYLYDPATEGERIEARYRRERIPA